jgi:signal transduction histidine kinase
VDDILVLLRPELERRRITVGWSDTSGPGVGLDKNQIEQALVNVILNAIEAIGEDGRIDVSLTTVAPGRARLSVKDSGPGIPPDLAAHLFTPFFSSKRNGRGVGLTLVSEILSNHEADFGLVNRPEGGAEFWMEFR